MRDWHRHWQEFPTRFDPQDFLRQVGKTQKGAPISAEQLRCIADSVRRILDLDERDCLLDLCCGNGLLTSLLACSVRSIVAVDYSRPLLEIARRHHAAPGVTYVEASVLELPVDSLLRFEPVTKVQMYEALQHFTAEQLGALLHVLKELATGAPILFGSVPDRARLRRFYHTPELWREYEERQASGSEAIGTWWTRADLSAIATGAGYEAVFLAQDSRLHTSHYRFDVLMRPA